MGDAQACCPAFDPAPWQERILALDGKKFVRVRVRSFLRVPLNFGAVLARTGAALQAAGAAVPAGLVLADENSLWGADVYLEAARDVPGARMAALPGTFLAQAYEGSYRDIPKWIADLKRRAANRGRTMQQVLFWYTTCPTCAQRRGRNDVVLFARI
ncbi:MAG: hydrolase [Kiritimatiellia bacterium]